MKTGVEFIAAERDRQLNQKGLDASRDDQYVTAELPLAAIYYAFPSDLFRPHARTAIRRSDFWPPNWDSHYAQANVDDRLTQLAKAGALIAAEIDRILRAGGR